MNGTCLIAAGSNRSISMGRSVAYRCRVHDCDSRRRECAGASSHDEGDSVRRGGGRQQLLLRAHAVGIDDPLHAARFVCDKAGAEQLVESRRGLDDLFLMTRREVSGLAKHQSEPAEGEFSVRTFSD